MSDGCCDDLLSGSELAARQFGVAGFAALWHGQQPPVATLGADRGVLGRLVDAGRLEVDRDGLLVGVHGLVARPTAHRIEHADGMVHTWCALDAIGIPAALGITATAVTHCPTCAGELRVVLDHGQPIEADEFRLWLPAGPCTHLVEDFCAHTNLYCDAEHLAAIVPAAALGRAVTIGEAVTIGRSTWSDVATAFRSDRQDPS